MPGHLEATVELLGGQSKEIALREQQDDLEAKLQLLAIDTTGIPGPAATIVANHSAQLTDFECWVRDLEDGTRTFLEIENRQGVSNLNLARQVIQDAVGRSGDSGSFVCMHPAGLQWDDEDGNQRVWYKPRDPCRLTQHVRTCIRLARSATTERAHLY
jgi:hypothetical protein